MPERRSKGDDAIYFEHDGPCKDSTRHRRCPGRWRGEITTGRSPQGRRLRRRVSGVSKAAVQDALKELRKEIDGGISPARVNYTVRRCCEDWLTSGLPGRDAKTIEKNRYVLEPLLAMIGSIRLRDLDVTDVEKALAAVAATRSSSTVAMAHLALTRAITKAQAKNLVLRNVSALTGTPPGQHGRPSRSMTLTQATALTAAARAAGPRTHAYVMLSLCTEVRTEEARALRWEHVDFGDANSVPSRLPSVAVWRSVRARGDTKTRTSRRTLALPELAVTALQALHDDTGPEPGDPVFATATGQPLDAANVRRFFRAVCTTAGIGPGWTPRELRHTFVSLGSDSDVAVEEIARLVGHASGTVTETVYCHQLRPVMTTGAERMDALLGRAG
jgi:integrase